MNQPANQVCRDARYPDTGKIAVHVAIVWRRFGNSLQQKPRESQRGADTGPVARSWIMPHRPSVLTNTETVCNASSLSLVADTCSQTEC